MDQEREVDELDLSILVSYSPLNCRLNTEGHCRQVNRLNNTGARSP